MITSSHNPVGILLAAGAGRRFDPTGVSNKLTQRLPSGELVAVQAARNLLSVLPRVIAVARSGYVELQLRQLGCEVYLFSQAQQGMGASLSYAIQKITESDTPVDSVVVGLADMPYIEIGTIQQVVEKLRQGVDIVQPYFAQQAGHPVGFASRHFDALAALSGDIGARQLLQQFAVCRLAVTDSGIMRDIDYLTDLPEIS